MTKLVTVLEENVRYRDGKEWKRRYCILTKPDPKTGNLMLYITKQLGRSYTNIEFDEKSTRQCLKDEITGFESGRHMYKESSVMTLIGRSVVHCIAFSQTDTMLRWAETLKKLMKPHNFHATLMKLSETSGLFNKISCGIQGNLHVQSKRLCLIGEPSDGNKFICEWPIDNILSIDITDTSDEKRKNVIIKSNGKIQKVKGLFQFEVSCDHRLHFKEVFEKFLTSCLASNVDFQTNYLNKRSSMELSNQDKSYFSYTINCHEFNSSNSEQSSSVEKRSSEIPIPRSREHSGPDARAIDDVQNKIRKNNKNICQVLNENAVEVLDNSNHHYQHHHHHPCLFSGEDEMQDEIQTGSKESNFVLYGGLSQESSGVYVNEVSTSLIDDTNLVVPHIKTTELDSGCANLSNSLLYNHHHHHQSHSLKSTSNKHNQECNTTKYDISSLYKMSLPRENSLYSTCHNSSSSNSNNSTVITTNINSNTDRSMSSIPNICCLSRANGFIIFYENILRNPLSLNNYRSYFNLSKILSANNSPQMTNKQLINYNNDIMRRTNSFNCVYSSSEKNCDILDKKYSSVSCPFIFSYESIKRYVNYYRKQNRQSCSRNKNQRFKSKYQSSSFINNSNATNTIDNSITSSSSNSNALPISNCLTFNLNLPFNSLHEFHNTIKRSIKSGTHCYLLVSYDHFLTLLKELKLFYVYYQDILKNFKNPNGNIYKNEIYDIWLDKVKFGGLNWSRDNYDSSNKNSTHINQELTDTNQLIDFNFHLIFDIISSIYFKKNHSNNLCDCFQSQYCCLYCYDSSSNNCGDTTAAEDVLSIASPVSIDLIHKSLDLTSNTNANVKPVKPSSHPITINNFKLRSSANNTSTPDFRSSFNNNLLSSNGSSLTNKNQNDSNPHCPPYKITSHSHPDNQYQNMSYLINKTSLNSNNNTFPKHSSSSASSAIKIIESQSKGGSFKKFRRKGPPSFLAPFWQLNSIKSHNPYIRRKTLSTHSTLSEPSCPIDSKEQNSYYNIKQHHDSSKRSLSVVLDNNYPYEDVKDKNYVNIENNLDNLSYADYMDEDNNNEVGCDISYPEEILDPSRNYGNLNVSLTRRSNSSKLRLWRQDSADSNNSNDYYIPSQLQQQNISNIRRSSLSMISPGAPHTSGHGTINSNHSSVSPTATLNTVKPLNYVTVIDPTLNSTSALLNNNSKPPLVPHSSASAALSLDVNSWSATNNSHTNTSFSNHRKTSPVVDYLHIDLNCTYALHDIDKILADKYIRKSNSPESKFSTVTSMIHSDNASPSSTSPNPFGKSNSNTTSILSACSSTSLLSKKSNSRNHFKRFFYKK